MQCTGVGVQASFHCSGSGPDTFAYVYTDQMLSLITILLPMNNQMFHIHFILESTLSLLICMQIFLNIFSYSCCISIKYPLFIFAERENVEFCDSVSFLQIGLIIKDIGHKIKIFKKSVFCQLP